MAFHPILSSFGTIVLMIGSVVLGAQTTVVEALPVINPASAVDNEHTATPALDRADDGLFYVTAGVNGHPVRFVVDTGASVTILTAKDAARAGLTKSERRSAIATADGMTHATWSSIRHVRIADTDLVDTDVLVMDDGPRVSLLGQNVLTRLNRVTIDGNQLHLR